MIACVEKLDEREDATIVMKSDLDIAAPGPRDFRRLMILIDGLSCLEQRSLQWTQKLESPFHYDGIRTTRYEWCSSVATKAIWNGSKAQHGPDSWG